LRNALFDLSGRCTAKAHCFPNFGACSRKNNFHEASSLIRNKKTDCSGCENCHANKKSEAIALCKEMPVILVNKAVDNQKNNWKKGAEEEERHKG
jgi:hypothetical protein